MTLLLLPLEISADLVAVATLSLFSRMSVVDFPCPPGIFTVSVSAWGSGRAWPGLGPAWACLGPCGGDYSKQKRGVML